MRYEKPLSDGELKRFPVILRGEYPKSKGEVDFQLEVQVKPGVASPSQPEPTIIDRGYRLLSNDDQRIVIVRKAWTLFSYQAPYPGWDQFVVAAKSVFDIEKSKLGYRQLNGIGLRYTNRLDIPLEGGDKRVQPSDYLRFGVTLPDSGVSTRMNQFQVLTDIQLNHDGLVARVQASTAPGALIGHASIVFDIDIMATKGIPQREEEVWALVARMRDDKNAIFESSITDGARKLFGWTP